MNKLQQIWKILTSSNQQKAAYLQPGQSFEIINGQIISSPDNKKSYLTNGYNINDIIYSIVQAIAEKVKVAPWAVYKVTDADSLKKYQAIMSCKDISADDYIRAKNYRKKALEPFNDGKLNDLLINPNDHQTFNDLVADSTIYKLLTGDRFIWAELLNAGANNGKPQSLELLPSQCTGIIASRGWPMKIEGYKLDEFGLLNLPKESVFHDKYFNPNYDTSGMHLFGLAPMKAAMGLTDRSNSENTMGTASYQNGGPKAIVFVDEPAWGSGVERLAQASEIKRILTSKEYKGPNNSNKLASSAWKMGVATIGLSPVEMDLIASEKWTLRRFCNVFGAVPSQVFNDPDNKVYNNAVEGEKTFTSRGAIPHLNSFRNTFNRKLGTDWGYAGKNIYIDYDMTVYSELQENMKDKWTWVKELPVSNGYKLDLMGLDHEEGQEEFMNQILIPSGYELSDSFGENETDRVLAAGDEEVSTD